jgi:hypothetical protein
MNGQGNGYVTLLNMATRYRHPKLVVDGRHTSAPKQRYFLVYPSHLWANLFRSLVP